MESSIGRVSQSLDARTMQEVTLVPYQLFIVCKQVHHFDLIISKNICEKILAKIINFSVSSISVGFVSFQSTFLSIVQQEPLRRVWSSKAMTSLGDNRIAVWLFEPRKLDNFFECQLPEKNIRRFSMRQTLAKFCCPRHPCAKLGSVAEADLASSHHRRCCGLWFLPHDQMIPLVTLQQRHD